MERRGKRGEGRGEGEEREDLIYTTGLGEGKEPLAGYCMVKVFKDEGSSGGYLLFPEFKIALDIRNLGFAIFQAWKYVHANSKVSREKKKKKKRKEKKRKIFL